MNEPKTDLMVGVVDVVGVEMALELFKVSSTYKISFTDEKSLPRLSSASFQYSIVLNNRMIVFGTFAFRAFSVPHPKL